ncbi:PAS domain S-box protein [Candidatus Saccharibacteria bacterium]|nr:PAS domain S-box protein [Candidatus Saccharibacteria bacterium]
MQPTAFKRQTLALFFIVSLIPALVVAAVWYLQTSSSNTAVLIVSFKSFILPVMLLGIIPAVLLSFIFAELLTRPIRTIHDAVSKLADGNFLHAGDTDQEGEFGEIGLSLIQLSRVLEQTLSETKSQSDLVAAERNKLRGVLNSMTDGVFALDAAGRIILFNHAAAKLTGRTIAEAGGQLAEKVIPLRQKGELVMTRWLATERGADHKVGQWDGLELYRADGSSLYVNVQAVVLPHDPNGIDALITFHDVTAGHELEEMKVDFVALAAHELRTPLTEVRGYLDILRHDLKRLTKDETSLLNHAVSSAEQLGGLINNLLSVARIEHGEINYLPEIINYRAFLIELMAALEDRGRLTGRKVSLKLPAQVPNILADTVGLREIIRNLVDNGLIHTAPGGHVVVSVEQTGSLITTHVSDDGEGIPPGAINKLFTKFYRVNELTNPTRGTGLGLFICRQIVEAHGGTISVITAVGKGTTFSFTMPQAPIAPSDKAGHNKITTRGAHGWIKDHSVR